MFQTTIQWTGVGQQDLQDMKEDMARIKIISIGTLAILEGKAKKVVSAQNLWKIEIGTRYMLFKDACNRKSNQQNLGTIKSSNLCTEIIEYTSPTETTVCNLASIALPRYVREKDVPIESHPSKLVGSSGSKNRYFDFDKLAEVHPNSYALVASTEGITLNWYLGNNRSMLVTNCLFRMGAGAVLLSNRTSDHCRAKYQLMHIVRTHKGNEDHGYGCTYQEEDTSGIVGVSLSKELAKVSEGALKSNISTLAPLVLPISDCLRIIFNKVGMKLFQMKSFSPNFNHAFEHICIHPGGRAILDKVEKNLKLTEWQMEPSRSTLYRFGNTSSSSLWYELAYLEAKGRINKGDRIWQIAFGAGFKCNSAVWKALRTINPGDDDKNPWVDEIDTFPVHHMQRGT